MSIDNGVKINGVWLKRNKINIEREITKIIRKGEDNRMKSGWVTNF